MGESSVYLRVNRGISRRVGEERGGAEGIRLPTMAEFLDLKYSQVKALCGETPVASTTVNTQGPGREGRLRAARKLARRPTLLSLHLAAFRKSPDLSFAKQKGHPFIHMQEDKFSSQPPKLREAPRRAR